MARPGQDEFAEELRPDGATHMFVPDLLSVLLREFGAYTESSR